MDLETSSLYYSLNASLFDYFCGSIPHNTPTGCVCGVLWAVIEINKMKNQTILTAYPFNQKGVLCDESKAVSSN